MKWFHSACARLRLLFARRGAESRMNDPVPVSHREADRDVGLANFGLQTSDFYCFVMLNPVTVASVLCAKRMP
jgi:hypothetical protein